jgi:hypothetical protein
MSYSIKETGPMHKWMLPLALIFIAAPSCTAQDKFDLFGGYSYVRGSIEVRSFSPLIPCPPNCFPPSPITHDANLNGWEASGVYKFNRMLGLAGDFGGDYGTLNGGGVHMYSYLFGPQLSFPARVSPFVHGLFGGAHESVGDLFGASSLGSDNGFAFAVGGGIDVKVVPFISVRLIQADYLQTHLYGHAQNQPRVSAGLVFHF